MKFVSFKSLAGAALAIGLMAQGVVAQDLQFFRIGTGGTAGTYYPIGGLIANAISNPPGSGTLVDAKIILGAFGLTEADITPEYLKPDQASDRMRDGAMDAFFFVGGYPAGAIAELSSQHEGVMVPITGPEVDALRAEYKFFANDVVPAGTYKGQDAEVPTLSVGAQLVTSADLSEELVYGITKAMFNETTQKLFANGHSKGKFITLENAVQGAGIPFHPGAEKFYRDVGAIK